MATILAVHAHPDDIEHLAAGTLALLAARGHAIRIATLTAGECGSTDTDLSETARIRKDEAAARRGPDRRRLPLRRPARPGGLQR